MRVLAWPQAQQNEVVARQDRVLDLWQHGAIEADDAWKHGLPALERLQQIGAHLVLDGARDVARSEQLAERLGLVHRVSRKWVRSAVSIGHGSHAPW